VNFTIMLKSKPKTRRDDSAMGKIYRVGELLHSQFYGGLLWRKNYYTTPARARLELMTSWMLSESTTTVPYGYRNRFYLIGDCTDKLKNLQDAACKQDYNYINSLTSIFFQSPTKNENMIVYRSSCT
jgi:hypothetical protein